MGLYNAYDIAVSPSGDLVLDSTGDFSLTYASGVLKQDISFRIRTNPGELETHPEVGAGLDSLVGEPNTRETSKDGEGRIINSLIYDGMVRNADLYVRGVPINNESIMYYVFVNNGEGQWNLSPDATFSLIGGMTNIPGA
jgi:hypothetical protein